MLEWLDILDKWGSFSGGLLAIITFIIFLLRRVKKVKLGCWSIQNIEIKTEEKTEYETHIFIWNEGNLKMLDEHFIENHKLGFAFQPSNLYVSSITSDDPVNFKLEGDRVRVFYTSLLPKKFWEIRILHKERMQIFYLIGEFKEDWKLDFNRPLPINPKKYFLFFSVIGITVIMINGNYYFFDPDFVLTLLFTFVLVFSFILWIYTMLFDWWKWKLFTTINLMTPTDRLPPAFQLIDPKRWRD